MHHDALAGRVAIVTGASRGIGKGIALALAEAGADVVLTARTGPDVEAAAREVSALGRQALAVVADVTVAQDVIALSERALAEFGRIDILVNNVGGGGSSKPLVPLPGFVPRGAADDPALLEPIGDDEWRRVFDVNLTSAFLCCRAVGPHMLERRSGKVINVTSPSGERSVRNRVAYSTAKAAVNMFTKALAQEWAPYNINVNCIGPGLVVNRDLAERPELVAKMVSTLPLKRAAAPEEIGALAVYLASPASDFMTGEVVYIDGGQRLI